MGRQLQGVVDGKPDQTARIIIARHLLMIGGREEPGPCAIACVGTDHQAAVDIAKPAQALGVVLVAAEAPARQRARLEAIVLNEPEANVVGAANVDDAAALRSEEHTSE